MNRCNIPTATEKCFKTLLAGSSNKKYAQINLYNKDRKALKEFMAYLIHILKEKKSLNENKTKRCYRKFCYCSVTDKINV